MAERITKNDIRDQLVKSLKPIVEQMRAKEAAGAEALAKSQKRRFGPGDTVRLTGKYLASTGSTQGTKRFKVVEHKGCRMCESGSHVAVDEEGYGTDGPRHIGVSHLEHSKLKKDDGTGMSTGTDMSMSEMGKAELCKSCGYEHAPGKHGVKDADGDHDGDMAKDEDDMGQESTPCSLCGGPLMVIGALGNRQHSMCRNCGGSSSAPMAKEPGGPAATADDPMGKAELDQVKSAPEKTESGAKVPDGPGKTVEAKGSGGKLGKADTWNPATGAADEAHVRGSVAAKMAPTPGPKKSAAGLRGTPENKIKPLAKGAMPGMGTANPPAQKSRIMDRFKLGQGGTPAGARVPLPGITPPVRAPGTPPPTPAAAMKKPGMTVMSKLRGGPTSPAQANKEIGGFKSLAGSATHLAPMGKAALPAAPKAPKAPSMAAPAGGAQNPQAAATKPPSLGAKK